jgi:hypothetical protein
MAPARAPLGALAVAALVAAIFTPAAAAATARAPAPAPTSDCTCTTPLPVRRIVVRGEEATSFALA